MSNPYYSSKGYIDPAAYVGTKETKKRWRVWGYKKGKKLPDLMITADSFDEAIKKARNINKNYNCGQIHENRKDFKR